MSGFLDAAGVAKRLGIKTASVWRYRKSGRLPEPDHVFGRSPVWRVERIEEYVGRLGRKARAYREEAQ